MGAVLFGSVEELFRIADVCKSGRDYRSANILWAFMFDWYVGRSSLLESDGERDFVSLEYETDGGAVYYDLAVLVYKTDDGARHFNIPVPLLTKDALCMFFRHKPEFVERRVHERSSSHEPREIRVESYGIDNPGWVLEPQQEE